MKRLGDVNGSRFLYAVVLLPLIAAFAWWMLHLGGGDEVKQRKLSVIVDSSQDSRWVAFRSGVERAAEDNGLTVNFVNTGKLVSLADQRDLIQKELEEGAEAIVLQLCASEGSREMLSEFEGRVKIVLIENGSEDESGEHAGESEEKAHVSVVRADDYEIGKALGYAILANRKHDLRVGVITGDLGKRSMRRRKEGLEEALAESGIRPVWDSGAMLNLDARIRARQETKEANTFVAMDNEGLEAAVDYVIRHGEHRVSVYGAGHSDRNVYHLDQGIIRTMAVVDTFNMGYQAAEEAGLALRNRFFRPKEHPIQFHMVRRETMFQPENQRLLFPLVE